MKTLRILTVSVIGLLVAAVAMAQDQQDTHKHHLDASAKQQEQGMMGSQMMERCQAMMEKRQKMQAEMKAKDAELDKLVANMNNAPQDKKVDATVTVITKLVEQRKAMHEKMAAMHMKMMQHMMEHMQMGKESMSQCPMMKGMMNMGDSQTDMKKPGDDHSMHHQ